MNKNMNNQEIAKLLRAVAAAYEIKDEKKIHFQIIAYDRAASAIEHATSEIKDLWDENKLTTIPGIGQRISKYLDEIFKTGKVRHFQKLIKKLPPAMFEFIEIPGIGAKTAYKLCKNLGIHQQKNAIEKLKQAALKGKIRLIEGLGEQSEKAILDSSAEYGRREKRMLLAFAAEQAEKIVNYLKTSKFVKEAHPLGSLRRCCSMVGDIDIAVATNKPAEVIKHFTNYPEKKKVINQGSRKATILLKNSQQIDLRVQKKESFGAMLQYLTGSKMHNIHLREIAQKRNLSLSEYGIKKLKVQNAKRKTTAQKLKLKKFKDEESFYNYLKMDWPPPELREDKGEIEAASQKKLPKLVKFKEIKGDLHVHTNFDTETAHDLGLSSFEEIVNEAYHLGYDYIGLADHTPSISNHSKKQIIDLIKERNDKIEQFFKSNKFTRETTREKGGIKIFKMMETDILANGQLSLPEEALKLLDFVIASIHSGMNQSKKILTQRVLNGLEHPKVKILGHPTGRLLLQREGYELDWDKIFSYCQKNNKWLEINSCPDRLDLPDFLVREAVKSGVKMVISTDSHQIESLKFLRYGVSVARRGWAEKKDIINTLSWRKLKDIIP